MSQPFSSPPIAAPGASETVRSSSPMRRNRSWRQAPFVVRIWAFYLTLFAAGGLVYGLSLIAYVQFLRSNFWMFTLCFTGIVAAIIVAGWHLLALRQGKKRGWYFQLIWSVGLTALSAISLIFALFSGMIQTIVEETLKTASPFGAYISLSHIVISLLWFRPKVRNWFGVNSKVQKSSHTQQST